MNRHAKKMHSKKSTSGMNSWWSAPVAFIATVLALPVNAGIAFPDDPLTTGNRIAPNVLFILDDSGSMAWRYMYTLGAAEITGSNGFRSIQTANNLSSGGDADYTTTSTSPVGIYDQNFKTNTLYYNPTLDYEPWIQANGNDMTGGTSYSSAYDDTDLASSAINLGNNLQVFYVPKDVNNDSAAYIGNVENYYRFHILPTASGGGIVRGAWGNVVELSSTPSGFPKAGLNSDGGWGTDYTFTVPVGTVAMEVSTSGGTHGTNTAANNNSGTGPDLYVRRLAAPSATGTSDCVSQGDGNDESCVFQNPAAGTWHVQINGGSRYRNVTLSIKVATATNRCEFPGTRTNTDFVNCILPALPSTKRTTVDAEKKNFATWYSYHRTRIKAAKAGAGRAFKTQGNNIRVGYRTINNRSNYNIPVGSADGRFIDDAVVRPVVNNRTTWYSRLYAAEGSSGTPLQSALNSAGNYFSDSSATGPYGPLGVNQYSCRQNFTILTTDGFWNGADVDVQNSDGTNGSQITNGKPATDPNYKSYTYTASSPYSDGRTKTLADVAMHYWKRDLRTDLANNVPSGTENPAFWQHMVTFGISIGLSGTSGWKSVDEVPANANWPDPTDAEDSDRIDDLLHASVNGRGRFVSAMDPGAFTAGLSAALAVIEQRTSSYSNVSTNSTSLNTGAQVFSASYTSGLWSGELKAQAVTRSGVSSTVSWTASIPSLTDRRVFTMSALGAGASFPTATQALALTRLGGPVDYPVTGAQNADYIKGSQSMEGSALGMLRVRSKLLGDVVGSSPVFVKGGAAGDGTSSGTVYVGANDGMLHAFDAGTGRERFAYVPNIINFNSLSTLSRGDYAHKFFVDGPISVSSRLMTPGKNLLVGSLGRGGKGLYSLDVSAPAAFAAGNVKWERSETDGNNMGLVLGAPILAKVRNGVPVNAAVVGNGPNSTNERAVLVVLNLETGAVIREIDTGIGSASLPNGLSAPVGVYAADGATLVYVYAGDMQGNVWKFDLRSAAPASWTATKLFTAAKGTAQPITGGLAVAVDPATNKRWVFFGTGRFMTADDVDDRSTYTQSLYGVMDEDAAYTRSNLTQRTVSVTERSPEGYDVRAFEAKSALPQTSKGWYVDLPGAGERVVQDAQIAANFLITTSMIPEGDACEGSGTGFINALDAFTGTSGGTSFFDLNNDGQTDNSGVGGSLPVGSANMGVGMPTRPVLLPGQFVLGGSGNGADSGLGGGRSFRMQWQRVSWREVRQD